MQWWDDGLEARRVGERTGGVAPSRVETLRQFRQHDAARGTADPTRVAGVAARLYRSLVFRLRAKEKGAREGALRSFR